VGSVKLTLSGNPSATRTETGAPYSLFGDKAGDLKGGGFDFGPGHYHFEADVFSGAKGTGRIVENFDHDFTVKSSGVLLVCSPVGSGASTRARLIAGPVRAYFPPSPACPRPARGRRHDGLRSCRGFATTVGELGFIQISN
jgi:hypothetical protein